jgi:hypothetical protein
MATYIRKDHQRLGPFDDREILAGLRDHKYFAGQLPVIVFCAIKSLPWAVFELRCQPRRRPTRAVATTRES